MTASEFIRENKSLILEKWLERLGMEIPAVLGHDKSAIENSVPDLLDAIVDALEANNTSSLVYTSKEHGKQRLEFKEYSLVHVVKEYHILKRTIFDLVDAKHQVQPVERDVIMHSIDEAIEQSAETYYQLKTQNLIAIGDSRESFFSSVSHDLKNPINNIKSLVHLIQSDGAKLNKKDIVRILKSSIERAEALVHDLMDVNMIITGVELPVAVDECNLVSKLKDMVTYFQLNHTAALELHDDLDNPIVVCDCNYLMRAVANLIDNAIKHGDENKKISIACKQRNDNIEISVHNYGPSIPLDMQSTIFNRYSRINKDKTTGWGIGLSLVKGIAEAHGGKVSVDSSSDEGTIFTITIPSSINKHS
jgi:signal transduction histidine kinase